MLWFPGQTSTVQTESPKCNQTCKGGTPEIFRLFWKHWHLPFIELQKTVGITILITSIQALSFHLVNSQCSQYRLKWGGEEGTTRFMWLPQNCHSKTWLLGESSMTWNSLLWKRCQICWFIFSTDLFFNSFSLPSRQSTALFSQNTSVRVLLTNLTGWFYTPTPNNVAGC